MTSEIGRRSPAVILLDLVRDFVFMSGRTISGAGKEFKKDCTDLIRRVAMLIHLAEEIGSFTGDHFENLNDSASSCSDDTVNSSSSDCLSELLAAIRESKHLLYVALTLPPDGDGDPSVTTNGAGNRMVSRFLKVTTKLENALGNLPFDHFCISNEVLEQVDLVRAQLKRAAQKYEESLSSISHLPNKKLDIVGSEKQLMTDFDIMADDTNDKTVRDQEKTNNNSNELVIPENFLCPISLELLIDPVIVSTGQTYERSNINRWIENGNTTCPKTQQQLENSTLTPNCLLKKLIVKWCIEHKIELKPGLTNGRLKINKLEESSNHDLNEGNNVTIETLVQKLISCKSIKEQRDAVTEIRSLSKSNIDCRQQIAEAGAIPYLVNLLTSNDNSIQENAISSILNLSLYEKNKKFIVLAGAIPYIAKLLKIGSLESRECAAATIYSLSLVNENKITIGASGVIPDLMKILDIGSLRGKKEAARALLNLCTNHENKVKAVRAGIMTPLSKMLSDSNDSMVEEAFYIMSTLCSHPEARVAMVKESSMMITLTDLLNTASARNKENAVAILLALCKGDSEKLAWLCRLAVVKPLMEISKNGTERGRRKAALLLDQLRKSRV